MTNAIKSITVNIHNALSYVQGGTITMEDFEAI